MHTEGPFISTRSTLILFILLYSKPTFFRFTNTEHTRFNICIPRIPINLDDSPRYSCYLGINLNLNILYNTNYQLYNQLEPTICILYVYVYTPRNVCPSTLCARVHHKKVTPTDESHRLTVSFHHIEIITIFCVFAALFSATIARCRFTRNLRI